MCPCRGGCLTGVIGVIRLNGKEHRLATYLGATAVRTDYPTVMVRQGGYRLCATLLEERTQPLLAPVDGQMNRTICESAACRAHYIFSHGGGRCCGRRPATRPALNSSIRDGSHLPPKSESAPLFFRRGGGISVENI